MWILLPVLKRRALVFDISGEGSNQKGSLTDVRATGRALALDACLKNKLMSLYGSNAQRRDEKASGR
jgi:hypothetical protein